MNVITTTDILFEHKTYPAGTKLKLSDEQAHSLLDQGVAKRATKTVEVADDEPEKAPASKSDKQSAPATNGDAKADQAEAPAVNKDMTRDELDAIAEAEGMTDLEQYETKADLVAAIKANRR